MPCRYVLDGAVAEAILSLSSRQRESFIRIFRSLAENPFQTGDEAFPDSVGRQVQKKAFGGWWISYWSDHASQEVRIVGVQKKRP